ncbi:class I SAM-dependent methyltransferase [Chloroflexota bacterium]
MMKQRIRRFLDKIESSRIPFFIKIPMILPVRIRRGILTRRTADKFALEVHYCNICGWRGEKFKKVLNEIMQQDEEIVCPNCLSEPRQRALFKYLRQNFLTDYIYCMKEDNLLCLEISPDRSNPVLQALPWLVYISIDLNESRSMYEMDLTHLTFRDNLFDLVVCSHVLEHIEDDTKALEEIYRVMRKGAAALIQIPIGYYDDLTGKHTEEFGGRRFCEHLRSYGWDFVEKLEAIGFSVDIVRYTDISMKLDIENEAIFVCKK